MSAITRMVPPHIGHKVISILKTLLSLWAQERGAISSSWLVASSTDLCVLLSSFLFALLLLFGTMSFLIFELGANMPWYRTRLCRGRGTSAASLLRKSTGENKICVVPLRKGFFSSYWILPSTLTVSRSRQMADRVTYLHRRSNLSLWYGWQDTAALSEKPSRSAVKVFSCLSVRMNDGSCNGMVIADDQPNLRHCGVVILLSSMTVIVLAWWLTGGRVDYLGD